MIDALSDRLTARVPDLAGRIDGAAEFADLMQTKRLPASGVRAYVLPLGLAGLAADAASGIFRQSVRRAIAVVLLTRSVDAAGERALSRLSPLVDEIVGAVAGWAPDDETGVFELSRANIIPTDSGLLGYQVEFTIEDQLRITP